ncbi:AAA family ATPase [Bacillus sp. FJAT-29790]|uniref:AAA family ATPase n=1 Tax=Bacillus sp. FJAT-29790 TaxID=1895002 RepID=UPI001C24A8CE|nr:AAA family ATPase [Bacillus sp. FJAT-29790]MBU8881362.1 AAA family ATPase [Bacillus sp. FJAT-29790]
MSAYKGLLITKDLEWSELIQQLLENENIDITVMPEWKRTFQEQQSYHYIFADMDSIENPELLKNNSKSSMIALTRDHDFLLARTWLVSGAKDVIVFPDEKERLIELVRYTRDQFRLQAETSLGYGTGQVHAFYSAKGGSGKTLLSAIAAQSLSIHHNLKVLLIDMDAQFGTVDSLFGLQPIRSYHDLIPVMEELDIRHIQNVSNVHEETKVSILTGPANPAIAQTIPDELMTKIINVASNHYDYIILDLPTNIDNLTFTGLSLAQHIHYIMTPDSLGMRAYKYAEDLFERYQIGRGDQYSLIVNRNHPKSELTVKDIVKIIGRDVQGTVSGDYFAIQPFLNMGESFFKKKKDKGTTKVTKDMKKYIDEILKR